MTALSGHCERSEAIWFECERLLRRFTPRNDIFIVIAREQSGIISIHPHPRLCLPRSLFPTRFYLLLPWSRASLSVSVRLWLPASLYRLCPYRRPDSTLPTPSLESYHLHPCRRHPSRGREFNYEIASSFHSSQR